MQKIPLQLLSLLSIVFAFSNHIATADGLTASQLQSMQQIVKSPAQPINSAYVEVNAKNFYNIPLLIT